MIFFFVCVKVLCRALGGKVGKAYSGWDIGLRKVRIVKDFSPCGFLEGFDDIPPALTIIECHQDEVSLSLFLYSHNPTMNKDSDQLL